MATIPNYYFPGNPVSRAYNPQYGGMPIADPTSYSPFSPVGKDNLYGLAAGGEAPSGMSGKDYYYQQKSENSGLGQLGGMVSADPWNSFNAQDFGKLFGLNQGSGVLAPVFGGHYNQLGAGMSNLSGLVR